MLAGKKVLGRLKTLAGERFRWLKMFTVVGWLKVALHDYGVPAPPIRHMRL